MVYYRVLDCVRKEMKGITVFAELKTDFNAQLNLRIIVMAVDQTVDIYMSAFLQITQYIILLVFIFCT